MRAAPKAASDSLSDARGRGAPARWPAARRLLEPAEFAAVTSDPESLRAGGRWLSLAGRLAASGRQQAPVRFGLTTSRRQAPRAVDRNGVRRVLRESARRHLVELDSAVGDRSLDIVLRLKSPLRDHASPNWQAWKAQLRCEADFLLQQLAARLRTADR
jgi:ribonuclease P protein component